MVTGPRPGILVVGQDQDRPGGGYDYKQSYSGRWEGTEYLGTLGAVVWYGMVWYGMNFI